MQYYEPVKAKVICEINYNMLNFPQYPPYHTYFLHLCQPDDRFLD